MKTSTVATRILMAGLVCAGVVGACKNTEDGGKGLPNVPGACSPNDAMMKLLAKNCAGCHQQGAQPFFASLDAFENLLVYNEKYVKMGHPEQSALIQLLDGTGSGTYKQMPIAGDSFAKLASDGKTDVTVAQVEEWITTLTPQVKSTHPDPNAVTIQRLSAEQVRASLYFQLGLTQDDFFGPASTYGTPALTSKGEGNYPIYSSDEAPGAYENPEVERHAALGGAQSLAGRTHDLSPSPPFAQALVGVSQAWCKMAIAKPGNKVLFPFVMPSEKSATAAANIKKNIAFFSLHFLSEPADPAEVDEVFDNVFVPLETETGPETAWAGVCAYFVRHPKWIFY